ncbi:unnamed protein product [Soboliphyme baturini]|uniref:Transposase n=1 Tax=Soboliphyme baturini TaxID=241478 RepID=A0A183J9Y2_9BILA|nr:unnamed protein product [Soboliphyme baturini]
MDLKLGKKSIVDEDGIVRLIEIRTVLERMRGVHQKLQYQIDKLLQKAAFRSAGIVRTFLAQFGYTCIYCLKENALEQKVENEDENRSCSVAVDETCISKKYVPPKLMYVPYDEKPNSFEEKIKKNTLRKSVIKDLQSQYSEAPEEIEWPAFIEGTKKNILFGFRFPVLRDHLENGPVLSLIWLSCLI